MRHPCQNKTISLVLPGNFAKMAEITFGHNSLSQVISRGHMSQELSHKTFPHENPR